MISLISDFSALSLSSWKAWVMALITCYSTDSRLCPTAIARPEGCVSHILHNITAQCWEKGSFIFIQARWAENGFLEHVTSRASIRFDFFLKIVCWEDGFSRVIQRCWYSRSKGVDHVRHVLSEFPPHVLNILQFQNATHLCFQLFYF